MTGSRNPNRARGSGFSNRAVRALLLCLLLPPVGLVYMWRALVFKLRGRILVTVLTMGELVLLFTWGVFGFIRWDSLPDTVAPAPGLTTAVTAAPSDDALNALSNIDALLSATDGASATATPQATAIVQDARDDAVYDTVVYAVNNGAQYYHASAVCGDQKNNRQLTLREALAEGLGACPNCNPVTP